VNAVLVDETTRRATGGMIDYAVAEPVFAKGKADAIRVWEAVQARSRFGVDLFQHARASVVGRVRELDVLKDALTRVREERSPQLVTLVGVPGIGKSRLVYELMRVVEAESEIVTWRQGRSLPYGDGVSFWALAEIVKAQAGIHENEAPEDAGAKLAASVHAVLDDTAEADWIERHLRPLAGLAANGEVTAGRASSEPFAAWRRFFEALADKRPAVIVFEDLHWADDALLDFVDSLVERVGEVPLLVVATTRPEARLLGCPDAGRVRCAGDELEPTAVEREEEEHVKPLQPGGRDREEITSERPRRVLAEKVSPETSSRCGAGGSPWLIRIVRTDVAETKVPRLCSSPTIRL
jgi:AAA ATPase-like protein